MNKILYKTNQSFTTLQSILDTKIPLGKTTKLNNTHSNAPKQEAESQTRTKQVYKFKTTKQPVQTKQTRRNEI